MGMMSSKKLLDVLSHVEPIASMSAEGVRKLVEKCSSESVADGAVIFSAGQSDNQCIYVVSGRVVLKDAAEGEVAVGADAPEARYPLDDKQPHQKTAHAVGPVEIVRLDQDWMDRLISDDQLAVCKTEIREGESRTVKQAGFMARLLGRFSGGIKKSSETVNKADWIAKFKPPVFESLTPDQVSELLKRMELIAVKAGTVIIRQGDEGDYYYLVVSGTASVTRQADKGGESIFLADLDEGQSFGEDALLSNAKRNATVTMKTKGSLFRLAKGDFVELLKEPMLAWFSILEAQTQIQQGAVWLDVRSASDFLQSRLPGAISIPLHELRSRMAELAREKLYICCCDTGRLSSSACFLLSQRGYKAAILRGGVQRLTSGVK